MKLKIFLLFLLIIFLIFTISCSKECKRAYDCDKRTCYTPKCEGGVCEYNTINNCCGNGLKELLEDNKPGNECTCPLDYGMCQGNNGDYLEKYCNNNLCVWGVPQGKIQRLVFSEDKSLSLFEIELVSEYDNPFVLGTSNITIKITLKDDNEKLVYPIVFTQFRLFEKNLLLGQKSTNLKLNQVGDSIELTIPFDFSMDKSEEQKSVTLKVDYEYMQSTSQGDTLERDNFQEAYTTKFLFVNPLV